MNPFTVPTPRPYIVYEANADTRNKLLNSVQCLWYVINALGISAVDAYTLDYSLNEITYDTLYDKAHRMGRFDIVTYMQVHGWSFNSRKHRTFRSEDQNNDNA